MIYVWRVNAKELENKLKNWSAVLVSFYHPKIFTQLKQSMQKGKTENLEESSKPENFHNFP